MTASLTVFGDALEFIVDERRLILHKTWEHLLLSGAALAIALAISLPVGVWLGHRHRGSFLAVNVANLGRKPYRSLSAEFEHTVAVTEDGVEIFTLSPKGVGQPQFSGKD